MLASGTRMIKHRQKELCLKNLCYSCQNKPMVACLQESFKWHRFPLPLFFGSSSPSQLAGIVITSPSPRMQPPEVQHGLQGKEGSSCTSQQGGFIRLKPILPACTGVACFGCWISVSRWTWSRWDLPWGWAWRGETGESAPLKRSMLGSHRRLSGVKEL